jgi:hypothetical protein
LRRFGGITLSEILGRVAGLTRSSAFIDRSLVAVRGDQTRANEGHVLILINGRPAREVQGAYIHVVLHRPGGRHICQRESGRHAGVSPSLVVANGDRGANGFYVQHEHKLTGDLNLIGGVQANKIGNIALNIVPRAGIVWNPAAHFAIKLLYGSVFRAPSLDETLLKHPGLKGDPNLGV